MSFATKIKMISNLSTEAFEKNISEFIEGKNIISIQYSTELESSKAIGNNQVAVTNTNYVTRHYAMIIYEDTK